jgi:hypothetical protein
VTTEEKERYHRLIAVAESAVLDFTVRGYEARCELARTIIEVARELRLGSTSRSERDDTTDKKARKSVPRLSLE